LTGGERGQSIALTEGRETIAISTRPEAPPEKAATGRDAIEAVHLTKRFGEQTAVDDVTFSVPEGSIFGYVGPSGSGKTTTLRMLTGVYRPTQGEVLVLGRPPERFNTRFRQRLGYMPQHFVLYPDLSVWQNLRFAAGMYGLPLPRRRLHQLLELVDLDEHRRKPAREISGGMQRRLSLAATLVHDPQLLFLDEPSAGVDPVLRRRFWDHFRQMQTDGRTLFVTTQYVAETEYCDLVGVMSGDGRLIAVDTPQGLRRRAFGGDVLQILSASDLRSEQLHRLAELPFVRPPVRRRGDRAARVAVDEARTALPALMDWARAEGLQIESINEEVAAFDDVFVELMQREDP